MYYDILAKLKNAERAQKDTFLTPFTKMDFAVAKILAQSGYVAEVQKKTVGRREYLEIRVPKGKKAHVTSDFKIVSKPSRRLYVGYQELKPVKQGYGMSVISTPQGIMSNKEARKNKVGGEYLFEIW